MDYVTHHNITIYLHLYIFLDFHVRNFQDTVLVTLINLVKYDRKHDRSSHENKTLLF